MRRGAVAAGGVARPLPDLWTRWTVWEPSPGPSSRVAASRPASGVHGGSRRHPRPRHRRERRALQRGGGGPHPAAALPRAGPARDGVGEERQEGPDPQLRQPRELRAMARAQPGLRGDRRLRPARHESRGGGRTRAPQGSGGDGGLLRHPRDEREPGASPRRGGRGARRRSRRRHLPAALEEPVRRGRLHRGSRGHDRGSQANDRGCHARDPRRAPRSRLLGARSP